MLTNEEIKRKYNTSDQDPYKCNYLHIPTNYIEPNEDGVKEMNDLLEWIYSKDICKLKRTKSNGIKKGIEGLGFYFKLGRSGAELLYNGNFQLKVQLRHMKQKYGKGMSGGTAFNKFNEICKKYGLDMWKDWKLENAEIKKEIEAPIRWLNPDFKDKVVEKAYHLDGNNMWFGCFIREFPKYRKPVLELYNEKNATTDLNRKQDIKDIFTHTLGYCQSLDAVNMSGGLSQYAKAGINGCNREIRKLCDYYGKHVIAINTDGIWLDCIPNYTHIGTNIGDFKLDHKRCKFRAISANKYEYIEDNVYHPIISGLTPKDKIEPDRSKWTWGDIYSKNCKIYGAIYNSNKHKFNWVEVDEDEN